MYVPTIEMNVFEAILARRSVRHYTAQQIGRSAMYTLLEAAVRAPTATHQEPWAFVIIQDRALLQRLSDQAKPLLRMDTRCAESRASQHAQEVLGNPEFNIFYDASTLIVICAKQNGNFEAADCWLAAENLMLSASAIGLGSCIICAALAVLNHPDIKNELGIPAEFSAIVPIVVGKPSREIAASPRKAPRVLTWV